MTRQHGHFCSCAECGALGWTAAAREQSEAVEREVGVVAAACELAGHPPVYTTAQADTTPRPTMCACGGVRWHR